MTEKERKEAIKRDLEDLINRFQHGPNQICADPQCPCCPLTHKSILLTAEYIRKGKVSNVI